MVLNCEPMDAWEPILEQWQRIHRWHGRLLLAMEALPSTDARQQAEVDDMAMAFFMHCYHLKDWLIEALLVNKAKIRKEFVHLHPAIQVCRDLANGAKHLSLRQPSLGETHSPRPTLLWEAGYPHVKLAQHAWTLADLAQECLSLWQGYLKGLGFPE